MRKIWRTYIVWLILGVVFYLLFALIALDINFLEWHWLGRTVYIAGGVSGFTLSFINGLSD